MSRLCMKKPSVCTHTPLSNSEISQKLYLLQQIFASCLGPTGRLKHIHNNVGGHVVTSSTSSVLLTAAPMSHPVLKLVAASVLNHISRFGDGGLFAGFLCTSLLHRALNLSVEQAVVAKVYRQLLGVCNSYLSQDDCGCKVSIDFSNTQVLLNLVRGMLLSKPACALTSKDAEHMALQVTRAFLLTVPCDSPELACLGRATVLPVEGQPPQASAALAGLLLDMPEALQAVDVQRLSEGPFRLALFNISLAGDLAEVGDGPLEVHGEACVEEAILEQLLQLGEQMLKDEVKLLACQKVVHPVLQQYLKSHGVIVAERLGLGLIEPFVLMTGAQPVASFQTPVATSSYGQVKTLQVYHCGSRELLHLLPAGEPAVCTLVLCHRNETALSELKVTCERVEQVLRLTLREPSAMLGGGCAETHLAAYIRHTSSNGAAQAARGLACSYSDYLTAAEAFCHSLEGVSRALEHDGGVTLMDLCCAHCWVVPPGVQAGAAWAELAMTCGCGMSDRPDLGWTPVGVEHPPFCPDLPPLTAVQPRVLDSFPAKFNALQVAVETANLILDLKYIIQDRN